MIDSAKGQNKRGSQYEFTSQEHRKNADYAC
jgi:hypothetical protein